jgi:hypothetical protein
LRSVAARPIESSLELHDDPKEEAPKVEKQEAPIAASPVQVGRSQMRGFDFASATGNMVAYQAKLLEMTSQHAICFGLQPEACDNQVAIPICRRGCRIYKKAGRHVGEAVDRNGRTHKTMTSSRSAPPCPAVQHLNGCRQDTEEAQRELRQPQIPAPFT